MTTALFILALIASVVVVVDANNDRKNRKSK